MGGASRECGHRQVWIWESVQVRELVLAILGLNIFVIYELYIYINKYNK
jgi:hypothetical protein